MDTFISFNTSFCYIFSVMLMLLAVLNTLALDGFTSAHPHSGDLSHANYLTPTINWVSVGNISLPFPSPPADVSLADLLKKVHSQENIGKGYVGSDDGSDDIPAWKASLVDRGDLQSGGAESPHYFETAALLITVVLWGKVSCHCILHASSFSRRSSYQRNNEHSRLWRSKRTLCVSA